MTKTIHKANMQRSEPTEARTTELNATAAPTGEHGCEAASPLNQQTTDLCAEAIRTLAHRKWEAAGCPAGDGVDFWLEAEQELNAEGSGSVLAQG